MKNRTKRNSLIDNLFGDGNSRGKKDPDNKPDLENTINHKVYLRKNYSLLLSPYFVKICTLGTMIAWSSAIVLGIIIGQFDKSGPDYDLAGFNPLLDYISHLGSFKFTPIPIAFNFSMMITCLFSIPVSLYVRKMFIKNKQKFWNILASCLSIFLIIGFTNLFFAGFVNLDVSEMLNDLINTSNFIDYHSFFSNFSFAFLASGCLLLTLLHVFRGSHLCFSTVIRFLNVSKILLIINTSLATPIFIIFMANSPIAKCSDRFWVYLPIWKWAPMWEWLTTLSLTITIFWLCSKLLKKLNKEIVLK